MKSLIAAAEKQKHKMKSYELGGHTSSSIRVLLYSKWCLSMTEELCSFASGDKLLQKSKKKKV